MEIINVLIMLTAVVFLAMSGYFLLKAKKTAAKSKLPVRQVMAGSVEDLKLEVLGDTKTFSITFGGQMCFNAFLQELHLQKGSVDASFLKGHMDETKSAPWLADNNEWMLIIDKAGVKFLVNIESSLKDTTSLVGDWSGFEDEDRPGKVKVIDTLNVHVLTSDCGEDCRIDLFKHISTAKSASSVSIVDKSESDTVSHHYEVRSSGSHYSISEVPFTYHPVGPEEMDVFYPPPSVFVGAEEFKPKMSLEYPEIIRLLKNGMNVIVTGSYRTGKTELVKNAIAEFTDDGGFCLNLSQSTMTVDRPIITTVIEQWIDDMIKRNGGEAINVMYVIDEGQALNEAAKASLLDLMNGFASSKPNVTQSTLLSVSQKPEELSPDVKAPNRAHQIVELGYLSSTQAKTLASHLKNHHATVVDSDLLDMSIRSGGYSPVGFVTLGEVFAAASTNGVPKVSADIMAYKVAKTIPDA